LVRSQDAGFAVLIVILVCSIIVVPGAQSVRAGEVQQTGKPPEPTPTPSGPPPNDTESEVFRAALRLADNKTDPQALDEAVSNAVAFLQSSPFVAKVSRDGNDVTVYFKSGSEATMLGELAAPRIALAAGTEGFKEEASGKTMANQPPQGRHAVVLAPFMWQGTGDPSYTIWSSYFTPRLYNTGIYANTYYEPNNYVTVDKLANFVAGYHVYDFPGGFLI